MSGSSVQEDHEKMAVPDRKIKSLIKNTISLNVRVFVVAGISLFTTRLVLKKLGSEDFGIFAVITGFTGMLAFVNSALAAGTQRHVAYSLGAGDLDDARKWFSIGLFFHVSFAILFLIFAETIGLFLFERYLIIPPEKKEVAFWLYQSSILSTAFTVVIVPIQALFNAYEDMTTVAILSIVQNILMLLLALFLYVFPWNSLMLYGVGFCVVTVIVAFLNWGLARSKFEICRLDRTALLDKSSIKELVAYSGWNLFGAGASVARVQGTTILLNIFFGPIANTAFYVANQIASQIAFLSQSLLRAINPQIIKLEGANNRGQMVRLTNLSCKYSFFFLSLIATPLILETGFVLNLWLKEVPKFAILFTRLVLIAALVDQLTGGIIIAIQAIGKVAAYQAVVGSALIMNLTIGYTLFKVGMPSYSILLASIFVSFIAGIFRLCFMKRLSGMNIREWYFDVLARTIAWLAIPVSAVCFIIMTQTQGSLRFFVVIITYFVLAGLNFFVFGIGRSERSQLKVQSRSILGKLNPCLRGR